MKHQLYMISIALACLWVAGAWGDDMKTRISELVPTHPRLLLSHGEDAALRRRIAQDQQLGKAFAHVQQVADALLDVAPVEREQVGRRLLGVSRTCLKRLLYLAMAYRVTGEQRYALRAQQEMLAAAAFTDWNPSHFLDVAEMTAALGIGYDWLHDALDADARLRIRTAILEKGLNPSLDGGWWVTTTNNWNQVCHAGLVLGALAIAEDEPELAARIVERAIENVPRAMGEYAPDGAYPEGPTYWDYGTTFNVILIAALESVFGTDFALANAPGFLASSDYYLQVTGPTGMFFNYSDCGLRGGVSPAMYWFASRREKQSLLWLEQQELTRFLARTHRPESAADRFFPLLLVWGQPLSKIVPPDVNHWQADGKTPVGLHRSDWNSSQATFAGIKGGSPGANHAHMDIGSFVMDARGVRWADDLGMQDYHSLESQGINLWDGRQDGVRWDIFRLNNFSHNTLVVDGQKQRVDGDARIICHSAEAPMPHTIVDMSSVYRDQLASTRRGLGLLGEAVLIRDEITTLAKSTTVRWGMVTRAEVRMEEPRLAILQRGEARLRLRVIHPATARLEIYETEKPPRAHDTLNKGTRMIGFTIELPASAEETLLVFLEPVDTEADAVAPLDRRLAEW